MPRTDSELVTLCLAGQAQAFEEIVERYQSLILAVVYKTTGDLTRSRDLAQETFLAAWKDLRFLREPDKLKSWLCGIARNLACHAFRRSPSENAVPLDDAADLPHSGADQREASIRQEEEDMVREALQSLPETYREALILYYWEQQSVRQVADRLEIEEDAARQRLSRGRKMLKEQVSAMVEGVLSRATPGKAFTLAVMAALPAALPQAAAAGVALSAAKGSTAAKTAAGMALGGAVWGPLLGLMGAWYGVSQSLKNARSPRERSFLVRGTVYTFIYMIVFYGILGLLGFLFRRPIADFFARDFSTALTVAIVTVGGFYSAGLFVLIHWINKRVAQIQKEDGTYTDYAKSRRQNQQPTKSSIYGSIGGSLFGSLSWIGVYAILCGDWLPLLAITVIGAALFVVTTQSILRHPRSYYPSVIALMTATYLLNLAVISLRWQDWMEIYGQREVVGKPYDLSANLSLTSIYLLLTVIYLGLCLLFYFSYRQQQRMIAASEKGEKPELQ